MTAERFAKIYDAARNAFHRKTLDEFSDRNREKELRQALDLVLVEGSAEQIATFERAMAAGFPPRNHGLTLIP